MTDPTTNTAVETEYEFEKYWRRLAPRLRLEPKVDARTSVAGSQPRHLPEVLNLAEPMLPVDDLYVARQYLESLPTRPLDYARRVRFQRHVGIYGGPPPEAQQVLFPRSVRLRALQHPVGLVFGRQAVDPALLNPVPSRCAWQLQHLHVHLAAVWRGAATLPGTVGWWTQHAGVVIALQRGNAPVYHAAVGFRSVAERGVPEAWYSWVPAARPFVARHSIDALLGGCPAHDAPVVAVYVVTPS